MSAYLAGHGVRVVRARDGKEGLDAVHRHKPVATVLDILLPGMDGWKVLEQLRADPKTQGLPVIIASIVDEKPRGLAAGAGDYLVKPVGRESYSVRCAECTCCPSRASSGRRNCARALVVEDNPLKLKLIRMLYRGTLYKRRAGGEGRCVRRDRLSP